MVVSCEYGFLLEKLADEDHFICRGKNCSRANVGSFLNCQNCGGIYCEECLKRNVSVPGHDGDGPVLPACCTGCSLGNATGGEIRTFIKQKLFDIQEQRLSKRNLLPFENFQSNLELSYGPAPLLPETASLMVAPLIERSVCFEFCNKSEDYCCLKVVTRPNPIPTDMSESQFSIYWEVPRPDYVVLPPNSKVHGYFPDSVGRIELIILEENLFSKTNRAKSVSVEAANDPERVRLKRKPLCAVVYLKYKGRGENMKSILEPRLGAGEDSRSALFIRKLVEKVCSSWSRMDDPSVEAFPNVSQEDIQFATSSWECF